MLIEGPMKISVAEPPNGVGRILVIAFKPEVFATPISSGSVISIGIPIGAGIILMSWLMTGIYIRRANTDFDEMTKQIQEEAL